MPPPPPPTPAAPAPGPRKQWLSGTPLPPVPTRPSPRFSSRANRLSAALSRSFVSAQPLHTRAHSQISEIVGPMAPERYVSLPPRSPAAAKALIAVLVSKTVRDVRKLEEMRLRKGDAGERGGWFDCVLACLAARPLEEGAGPLAAAKTTLMRLRMPRNPSGCEMRTAQLPLEAFRLDAVGGVDCTDSVMPNDGGVMVGSLRKTVPAAAPVAKPAAQKTDKRAIGRETVAQDDADEVQFVSAKIAAVPAAAAVAAPAKGNASTAVDSGKPQVVPSTATGKLAGSKPPQEQTEDTAALPAYDADDDLEDLLDDDYEPPLAAELAVLAEDVAAEPAGAGSVKQPTERKPTARVTKPAKTEEMKVAHEAVADAQQQSNANGTSSGGTGANKRTRSGKLLAESMPSTAPDEPSSQDIEMINATSEAVPKSLANPEASRPALSKVELPVFLVFDDETGKVSIDWVVRIVEANQPSSNPERRPGADRTTSDVRGRLSDAELHRHQKDLSLSKSTSAVATKPAPRKSTSPVETVPSAKVKAVAQVSAVACNVRDDAPTTHLQSLLNDIDSDKSPATRSPGKRARLQNESPEVVLVDGDKETPVQLSKNTARRAKRKRTKTVANTENVAETEQRASKMRSAVVSALQEDPESRRRRAARTSTPANGHSRSKTKKSAGEARRSSRRVRRNAPIVDSSDSDDAFRRAPDDDFHLGKDDGVLEIPPSAKANENRARHDGPRTPPVPSATLQQSAPRSPDNTDVHVVAESPHVQTASAPRNFARRRSSSTAAAGNVPHLNPRISAGQTVIAPQEGGPLSGTGRPVRERSYELEEEEEEEEEILANGKQKEPQLWNRELLRVQRIWEKAESGSISVPSSDTDSDTPCFSERVPIAARLIKPVIDGKRCIFEVDITDEYTEMTQFYRDTRHEPNFQPSMESPGAAFLQDIWRQTLKAREKRPRFSAALETEEGLAGEDFEAAPAVHAEGRRNASVINLDHDPSRVSSGSRDSSEGSSAGDSSEEDEDVDPQAAGGSKRSRSHARSRASKARELQSRVCGDLLPTMTSEGKRRVLRWAERDFSWFTQGSEFMEIVASRTYKACRKCDVPGEEEEHCEESILLKLWKDMSWRKVRRMRHRKTGS